MFTATMYLVPGTEYNHICGTGDGTETNNATLFYQFSSTPLAVPSHLMTMTIEWSIVCKRYYIDYTTIKLFFLYDVPKQKAWNIDANDVCGSL